MARCALVLTFRELYPLFDLPGLAKNDDNRLLTEFTIKSITGSCTEKLFANRRSFPVSRVVIPIDDGDSGY